ncbi:recombination-associated protein RdgC [Vitreoscilla filiformis]|uniref:Recombination-associated protein RdgC n=1 Tax=Vitreoscilla filiformis TaxID=63 RepID=A0A221KAN8_VITFI|nr:recombination-associated protein RdgC [Vitreoscilla filiformis]ASM75783.1 recombination-associated protein RdgC [Vitreoscilla filiformis]ASM75907.1 recombination-associated protein RdgC [Vitreoscilla filiformis]ASM76419.1 recombination-associated protein RdgC [Vitreoscilla filiformis]ASM76857.1 recombination-associated protein RdgC [Vitreoscilla filiformis]ASM77294.1 recombination-associated protein RdgC [Vitreoscilla filiformis]
MFKNLILYAITGTNPARCADLIPALVREEFRPCEPAKEHSAGWVDPADPSATRGALVQPLFCHGWMLAYKTETKKVPTQALKARVAEMAEAIYKETGRRPGKTAAKDLAEAAKFELLPRAFALQETTLVWLDTDNGWLALDCASAKRGADIVTALVRMIPGLVVTPVQTQVSPAAAMSTWLGSGDAPWSFGLCLGRSAELHRQDETRAKVRYVNHSLVTDEVRAHVREGYTAKQLALEWDTRMTFVLTDAWTLRNVALTDVVLEENKTAGGPGWPDAEEVWRTDAVLMTAELQRMLADLMNALGGKLAIGQPAATAQA